MKQIIIGLFIMLLVACSGNDASGLYNYGKAKYNQAVVEGKAYEDSINAHNDSTQYILYFQGYSDFHNKNVCKYHNKIILDTIIIPKISGERCGKVYTNYSH
jgi:hypothetical protein